MSKRHINIIGMSLIFLSLVIGCAQKPRTQLQTSDLKDSGFSQAQIERLNQFEKDYAVVLSIHDHVIQLFPLGSELPTHTEAWTRQMDALHEAIGDDFTNYMVK